MNSTVNIEIEINHFTNIPSAQAIAAGVAQYVAEKLLIDGTATTFGRRTMVGPEDGERVTVFLRSAAVHSERTVDA